MPWKGGGSSESDTDSAAPTGITRIRDINGGAVPGRNGPSIVLEDEAVDFTLGEGERIEGLEEA